MIGMKKFDSDCTSIPSKRWEYEQSNNDDLLLQYIVDKLSVDIHDSNEKDSDSNITFIHSDQCQREQPDNDNLLRITHDSKKDEENMIMQCWKEACLRDSITFL